jgi:hypothetical protein
MQELEARVEALEAQLSAMRQQFKAAAHELRDDEKFMAPAGKILAKHMGDHWFDVAARRLLLALIGLVLVGAAGVLVWAAGKGLA